MLLELSAVFDMVDHNILIDRLDHWLGLSNMVQNCFKEGTFKTDFKRKTILYQLEAVHQSVSQQCVKFHRGQFSDII